MVSFLHIKEDTACNQLLIEMSRLAKVKHIFAEPGTMDAISLMTLTGLTGSIVPSYAAGDSDSVQRLLRH